MESVPGCMLGGISRGQSNAIGFVLIFAFVIVASGSILATVTVPIVDEPVSTTSEFDVDIDSEANTASVTYASGDRLTTSSTREVRFVNQEAGEFESIESFPISEGEEVIENVEFENSDVFTEGAIIQIVVIHAGGGSEVIDELFLPSADQLGVPDESR